LVNRVQGAKEIVEEVREGIAVVLKRAVTRIVATV